MKVGIFFGGLGNEREISIKSAYNIEKFIDRNKHDVVAVHWNIDGNFYVAKNIDSSLKAKKPISLNGLSKIIDIAFLVTHGKYGEDGVLQAILESAQIKYTGCGVLSSALCMDKVVNKKLMNLSKIPQVKFNYIDFKIHNKIEQSMVVENIINNFTFPVFVKPANSGSSVGITKVTDKTKLDKAIKVARLHDSKVLIEEGLVDLREIEVAVLGNSELLISEPGELYVTKEFYDFEDKYIAGTSKQIIPADISKLQSEKIKKLAGDVYKICECAGLARVDFFVSKNKIYFNEINTLPGFTNISMYPMLMDNIGVTYMELINRIIKLATK